MGRWVGGRKQVRVPLWKSEDTTGGRENGGRENDHVTDEAVTYEAVVFDMDGVLVEPTEDVVADAIYAAFEACGVANPPGEHVENLVAGATVEDVRSVCAPHGIDPATFWHTRDSEASRAQVRKIEAGGKPPYEDVAVLDDLDVPMGVVSSNQQATVEFVLGHHGLTDYFAVAYGRPPALSDIPRRKPHPHFIERTLADLGVEHALYVGDSVSDVYAAHRAGLDSLFVRRAHRAELALPVEPTYEVESLWPLPELVHS